MEFVWITSYLFVFLMGGIASLFAAYKIINKMTDKAEEELRASMVNPLEDRLRPYGYQNADLN